jgi:hypothetical protein
VYAKLQDKYMIKFLESVGAIRCSKCKQCWEHNQGKVDYNMKNDKGEKLSKYYL